MEIETLRIFMVYICSANKTDFNTMNAFNSIFTSLKPEQLTDNLFTLVDRDWMLITAGRSNDYNTMTASWGTMGILWHKPVAVCYIRPQRYTLQFAEKYKYFTLSFFYEQYREVLNFCGSHSGRNVDKARATGLTPIETDKGSVTFEQARMVIECKKLYSDVIRPEGFTDVDLASRIYPGKDYHQFFIGMIENCYHQ